ncbi:GNAT family N-acetyltransferase [uncultured Thiodictyon sp.]|uniref:GNAT family N-acetyltransferase n=1 Tax=uncultured Thiodictyon sp. TaxID=1846217 RepID=UPI0025FC80CE|nr:GNAT family N-acetyltransferase [uncultured Thiodictyon sp.]
MIPRASWSPPSRASGCCADWPLRNPQTRPCASSLTRYRNPAAANLEGPDDPLPTLRLARLAVARQAQRRGVGRASLRFALTLARRMAAEVGCVGVVVDAKPEARSFYLRYGFESLSAVEGLLDERPEPTPMFLPLSSIPCPDKA